MLATINVDAQFTFIQSVFTLNVSCGPVCLSVYTNMINKYIDEKNIHVEQQVE